MTQEIIILITKSKQSLDASKLLLKENYADFSAARTYYAIFYCIEALLLSKNLSFSKHSAVISAFGSHFIKTGIFDEKYHKFAIDAFDMRNMGDYGTMYSIDTNKAMELIQKAHELISAVEKYFIDNDKTYIGD